MALLDSHELGYFGNIWVRQHHIKEAGISGPAHKHHFDHVTLLVKGKLRVQVEGHPPKEFTAPTFIVVKKEHEHLMTALEDNTIYYCVFALRNIDGEVIEDVYGEQHNPLSSMDAPPDYYDNLKKLEALNIEK